MSPTLLAFLVAGGTLLLGWVALNLKTSRPDGVLVPRVHPYRRLMSYIMPGRNESIVFFDAFARADRLLEYVEAANKRFHCDVTHCLVGAAFRALSENPRMNLFWVGNRLYARKGRWITFSMKRKAKDKAAKLSAVKLELLPGETFEQLCSRINANIDLERSGVRTHADREFDLFTLVPRPLLLRAVRFFRWLDHHNVLPGSFIKTDAMYTSIFVANLGSVEMAPGFHHLYEWGTCPLFMMVGKIEDKPVVENGQVVARKLIHMRWSYDERIDDGLTSRYGIDAANRCLENPFEELGCVKDDGSDAHPLENVPPPA